MSSSISLINYWTSFTLSVMKNEREAKDDVTDEIVIRTTSTMTSWESASTTLSVQSVFLY